jgi:hypothetical protein
VAWILLAPRRPPGPRPRQGPSLAIGRTHGEELGSPPHQTTTSALRALVVAALALSGRASESEDRRRFFFQSRISTAALITVLHSGMQPPDHQPPQIRCSKCKRFKEQGAFLPRYDRKRGRRQPCRQCRRRLRKPSSGWAELRRTVILRSIALWLLGDECVRCGERDPVVLDFDHIDPETKDFSLSAAFRVLSWKRILEEVRKCQILCANDHRRKTAEALEATAKHSRRVVREFHLQPNVAPIRYIP